MNEEILQEQRARKAATDYIAGAELRKQQAQLTDSMLAAKFECSRGAIKRAKVHGVVRALDFEDQVLVRQCAREHDRLESRAAYFTKPFLSKHYGVPICAINRELDKMGFKNPLNRKDKSGRAPA